jgi:glutamate-1-semialdehyde aminotransferase
MFLPEGWPAYFSRAKGVEVWDLDGHRYVDMSIMGVGACVLGYADPDVDRAVKAAIDRGSMCTLNTPEEVELAELLLKLHPWAGGVRYTRTGGEALAVAVRVARAYTGRDVVAFCGYHGWHDWYLAANLADERALDGHLLPGLSPRGVPRCLKGTALPFTYNRLEELERIVEEHEGEVGAIVMEPVRHHLPEEGFLQAVRRIADRIGAVLIFDEVTTGWRLQLGGVHTRFGVTPDVVVYAKAVSNGYPMGVVLGLGEVMDMAQESFISSTYWTERIGPTAALATITKLRDRDVPHHLDRLGRRVMEGWRQLAREAGLEVEVLGFPALATFTLRHPEAQALQTLFTQLMLDRGYLAGKSLYTSYSHTDEVVDRYLEAVEEVFRTLSEAIAAGEVAKRLRGPVAHQGFRRLT